MLNKISVNILSDKFPKEIKKAGLYMNISIILVIPLFLINKFTGDTTIFNTIALILSLNMFVSMFYYVYKHKYVNSGKVTFDNEGLIVQDGDKIYNCKISEISSLKIFYNGYDDQAYFTWGRGSFFRNSTGEENIITFNYKGDNFNYKFSIPNKTVAIFLVNQLENYKKNGADIVIKKEHTFVEF